MKTLNNPSVILICGTTETTNVALTKGLLVYGDSLINPKGKRIYVHQHLYKVCDDPIRNEDWCFNSRKNIAVKFQKGVMSVTAKKIIATNDQRLIDAGVKPLSEKDIKSFVRHHTSPSDSTVLLEKQNTLLKAPVIEQPKAINNNKTVINNQETVVNTKRPVGRPRVNPIVNVEDKRPVGRPKVKPIVNAENKRPVGRPKVKPIVNVEDKRHVGRPRVNPIVNVEDKRHVGRPKSRLNDAISKFDLLPNGKTEQVQQPVDLTKPVETITVKNIEDFKAFLSENEIKKMTFNYSFANKDEYILFLKGVVSQIAHEYHTQKMITFERAKKMVEDAFNVGVENGMTNNRKNRDVVINEIIATHSL